MLRRLSSAAVCPHQLTVLSSPASCGGVARPPSCAAAAIGRRKRRRVRTPHLVVLPVRAVRLQYKEKGRFACESAEFGPKSWLLSRVDAIYFDTEASED